MSECKECPYIEEIRETNVNVRAIKRALIGDEFKPMGLIQEHEDLKMKVTRMNNKIIYYIGAGTGLIVVLGWLLTKFKLL
jgi:hypothetical protein